MQDNVIKNMAYRKKWEWGTTFKAFIGDTLKKKDENLSF